MADEPDGPAKDLLGDEPMDPAEVARTLRELGRRFDELSTRVQRLEADASGR